MNAQGLKIFIKNRFPALGRIGRSQQLKLRKCVIFLYRPIPSFRFGNHHIRYINRAASVFSNPANVQVTKIRDAKENMRTFAPRILEPVASAVKTRSDILTQCLFLLQGAEMRVSIGPFSRTGGQSIAIGNSEGTLMEEVSFDIFGSKQHKALARFSVSDCVSLHGKWIVVVEPQGPTYGHWLVEFLPRLAWICDTLGEEVQSTNWLISGSALDYEIWAINMLGIPLERVRWSNKELSATIEEVIVPSFVSNGALNVLPDMIERVRKRFNIKNGSPVERIYISRKGESFRRVINESEVIEALTRIGFRIINPREHSLREKIEIFSNSVLVVGPVSSGMNHCVFMPAGGGVLEVMPGSFYSAAEYEISDAAGHRFYVMQEENVNQGFSDNRFADLFINIDALLRLVQMADNELSDVNQTVLN